jgi:Holliday junction DNA helicase RuvA
LNLTGSFYSLWARGPIFIEVEIRKDFHLLRQKNASLIETCRPQPFGGMLRSMIGRLTGTIAEKGTETVLVDVGGIGYEVSLPLSTLATLPPDGETATLYIHTHVREDDIRLFGFDTKNDKIAFLTMLKVSGIGPKLALAVLGALSGSELARVIGEADTKRLTTIPGIGKKSAERMILELSGKLKSNEGNVPKTSTGIYTELGFALSNLGFKSQAVDRIIGEIRGRHGGDAPFQVLLREALGLLKEK